MSYVIMLLECCFSTFSSGVYLSSLVVLSSSFDQVTELFKKDFINLAFAKSKCVCSRNLNPVGKPQSRHAGFLQMFPVVCFWISSNVLDPQRHLMCGVRGFLCRRLHSVSHLQLQLRFMFLLTPTTKLS